MNVLLLSMPDSFEHMPAVAIRMPNGLVVAAIVGVHPFRRTGPVAIPFGSAGSATLLVTPFDTGADTSRLARLQSRSKRVKKPQ